MFRGTPREHCSEAGLEHPAGFQPGRAQGTVQCGLRALRVTKLPTPQILLRERLGQSSSLKHPWPWEIALDQSFKTNKKNKRTLT